MILFFKRSLLSVLVLMLCISCGRKTAVQSLDRDLGFYLNDFTVFASDGYLSFRGVVEGEIPEGSSDIVELYRKSVSNKDDKYSKIAESKLNDDNTYGFQDSKLKVGDSYQYISKIKDLEVRSKAVRVLFNNQKSLIEAGINTAK